MKFPRIKPMGEKALLITFEPVIDEMQLGRLLNLKKLVQQKLVKQDVEVITAYNSLLIVYPSPIEDVYGDIFLLKALISESNLQVKPQRRVFYIPVCYEEEFGLDLELVSEEKELSVEEIIRLHTSPVYTVYFTGFLPGFLYLGGLNKKLQISRKSEPRLEVKKGAVGIGENQTGIYPQTSPGGWQIIGNSPVPLFDPHKDPPCEISAGDKIQFYQISLKEHGEILKEVSNGKFTFQTESYGS